MERTRWLHLALELLTALVVVVMLLRPVAADDYSRFATDTLRYERAQVTAVLAEDLTDSPLGTGQRLGSQSLRVRLADGQEIELTNYLTETRNVLLHEGDRAIVCADLPEGAAAYYTIYSYDRTGGLLALAALFVGLLALVGRRKGLDACLAIVFTLVFLLRMGQDMIGTMSNTLIFAFAGGSLTTMLLFVSYGVQPHQLLNSDYLTIELAQGLCSTAAVILTVPCAAAIGALYHSRRARSA